MSRQNAYLKDENLLTLFSLNNMIVPEIQREYVWGNNHDVLDNFLRELESKAAPCDTCHHVHTNKNINVGFLYSYKPSYVKYESERILDEYLIDGQQRITTLFLLLLYRATIEGRTDDFMAICRADEKDFEMGFNYKVRSLTQQFLVQLILHAKDEGPTAFDFITDMKNTPYWFLDDYKSDPTIKAMVGALESIQRIFGNKDNFYFDFLLTNIHFWHFKTEATSQGEELYITMNSRGEQLTDNEMQKARKLPSDALYKYGKDWESWQTFFWRKRKEGGVENPNADKGFNNFLACIENLESFNGQSTNISQIKTYIEGLQYLCSPKFKESFQSLYDGLYTGWFDSFLSILWNEINSYDGKWDINDPRGGKQEDRNEYKNKSIARNKSMLFWSWMTYVKKCGGVESIDNELLIKILHFYYIRFKCYKRSSTSIDKVISCFIETTGKIHTQSTSLNDDEEEDNVNSRIFSDEEILLSTLYQSKEIESAIWEIQDLPYFIDGKGVGGNTIYEFFTQEKGIIDRENLADSIKRFKEEITGLLGEDIKKTSHIDIKRILLFYKHENKAFWKQQTPYYYSNYETCEWNRIVRCEHFINFFKEFTSAGISSDAFLEHKRTEFFKEEENQVIDRCGKAWSHRKLAILYDLLAENGCGIWDNAHENIAFHNNESTHPTNLIFENQETLCRGYRYINKESEIKLSSNWEEILLNKYHVKVVATGSATKTIEGNA